MFSDHLYTQQVSENQAASGKIKKEQGANENEKGAEPRGPGGGTKSGKVRVCEAGPPDPLPPPVHEFLKNIPPPVRSAVQHISNYRPPPVQGREHPPPRKNNSIFNFSSAPPDH